MIKVLIVDDSLIAQETLKFILNSDSELEVIGTANNGQEALDFLENGERPDVITMDIVMPKMNGYEATRAIMEKDPIPIVIISASSSVAEVDKSFKAYQAGAVTLMAKPHKVDNLKKPEIRHLINTVKTMSKVKLVKRWRKDKYATVEQDRVIAVKSEAKFFELVAIGVSTGGPPVLLQILKQLPQDFWLPIVIVQHIAAGFVQGLADWLNSECSLNIKVAENGESLKPSTVYLAGDGYQMGIRHNKTIYYDDAEGEFSIKPSVAYLFKSIAKNIGGNSIALLLTGMGRDGAAELAALKELGALTIIQDEQSSVVFGMPGVAKSLNAHKYELNPENIGKQLIELHNVGKNK